MNSKEMDMETTMLKYLDNFVNNDTTTSLKGGHVESNARMPGFYNMAQFVSKTLSDVLDKKQMYSIIEKNNDPKHLNPPLTNVQKAKMSTIVLNKILNPSQLREFAATGGVSMSSLDPVQTQIIADLSAGYMAGKVLDEYQFNNFVNRNKPFSLGLNKMNILRAGGLIGIPQIDAGHPVYTQFRHPNSKYMMELGRYMSEPATNFVRNTSKSLSGGGTTPFLAQFKTRIHALGI